MTKVKKIRSKNKNITYQRLKYCEGCKHVWERSSTGSILYYAHLPTYKLPRITCYKCKSKKKGKNK